METGILHAHITLVTSFLLFFVFKTILLLAGQKELLDKIRKYKMIDMVWGTLIIVTGGLLWYFTSAAGHRIWLDVKTLLVFISIGLGIVSMKKENKILAILTCLLLIYVYGVAETKSLTFQKEVIESSTTDSETEEYDIDEVKLAEINAIGKAVYEIHCNDCHGFDGSLGKFSATNLKNSSMMFTQKVELITNGKGMMAGFGNKISKQEIEAVASYIGTLHN